MKVSTYFNHPVEFLGLPLVSLRLYGQLFLRRSWVGGEPVQLSTFLSETAAKRMGEYTHSQLCLAKNAYLSWVWSNPSKVPFLNPWLRP